MLKFVVYDDEAVFRSKVVKSIDKVMKNTEIEYCKEEYDKCNSKMMHTIMDNSKKIYIMDIEIPNGVSGIDVARKIRETDWNSIIILVTSHVDMSYEALKAQIMLLDFISNYFY